MQILYQGYHQHFWSIYFLHQLRTALYEKKNQFFADAYLFIKIRKNFLRSV